MSSFTRRFGISERVARRVNESLTPDVHDLGRRLPGEPRTSLQLLNPEEAEVQMRKLSDARKEVREIIAHGQSGLVPSGSITCSTSSLTGSSLLTPLAQI